MRKIALGLASLLLLAAPAFARKAMEIYLIDVEGGQSTLFVSPKGESLLVDTGWPGNAFRDANRIVKAAKLAGVKKIDYLVITHFHVDHVGGVPQLVAKLPVGTFMDHGPNREDSNSTRVGYEDYMKAVGSGKHVVLKPCDQVPLKGFEAVVVSGDGNLIDKPLTGAGQPNPFCSDTQQKAEDPTENARSVGMVITFAGVRILDLGDLTWNKEVELVCPINRLGYVDLAIVSHHGMDMSNSSALVHAVAPRVAIFDNGSKKGAAPVAWDTVKASPGLLDIWQLHFADAGGKEHNAPDPFLANVEEADTGNYLKVTINPDGSYSVFNPRNQFSKSYSKR